MKDLKTTDIAVITTGTVENTFDNVNAYLHAVIESVKDDNVSRTRTYKVRTDLVGYKDVELPVLDEDGNPKFDENGNMETEIKEQLIWLEQKQDWALQTFTYDQIDGFADVVAAQIPEGLTRTQKDIAELQAIFLAKRREDAPWGIAASKWRSRTNEDLLKDKS
ncbi:hypothetical protein [Flagellimonas onchidii]|uniref:hypothetical protein n=1 Tax=Flagellimonas onchidii TaxID=2562684 RepID=UPI0010A6B1D6|nr:hypothetical protein [Allomuricauda onchidii]